MAILKQADTGTPVQNSCREHGISSATFYKWRSKFGGIDASMISRMMFTRTFIMLMMVFIFKWLEGH